MLKPMLQTKETNNDDNYKTIFLAFNNTCF